MNKMDEMRLEEAVQLIMWWQEKTGESREEPTQTPPTPHGVTDIRTQENSASLFSWKLSDFNLCSK